MNINYYNNIRLKLLAHGQVTKLAYVNFFERSYLSFALKYIELGSKVIDVGANIGLWSICLANKIGDNGVVYAFEPNKETVNILKKNLHLNNIESRVMVSQIALGNKISSGILTIPDYGGDADCFITQCSGENLNNGKVVGTSTIDECMKSRDRDISFIKVDCEGSELFVLQGAEETLSKNDNLIIVCEANPEATQRQGYNTGDLYFYLENNGFTIHMLDQKTKFVLKKKPSKDYQGNFIAAKGNIL